MTSHDHLKSTLLGGQIPTLDYNSLETIPAVGIVEKNLLILESKHGCGFTYSTDKHRRY